MCVLVACYCKVRVSVLPAIARYVYVCVLVVCKVRVSVCVSCLLLQGTCECVC